MNSPQDAPTPSTGLAQPIEAGGKTAETAQGSPPEPGSSGEGFRFSVPGHVVRGISGVATNAWKAKAKMIDSASGEVREEMKRVYRHLENVFASFQEMGVEVRDHTGDRFDYGLPLKVLTTQPTPGLTHEKVIETIKPTIYWERNIIQMGEVVIATPA